MNISYDYKRPDYSKAILVAILFSLWEGFPAALMGYPLAYAQYPVSVFIILAVIVKLGNWGVSRSRMSKGEIIALLMLLYMVAVTVIYSTVIQPQHYSEWLLSIYQLVPVALVLALRACKIRAKDIVAGLIIVGVVASAIVVVDGIFQFPVMEVYQRLATTDENLRRIVFLKMETAFALSLILGRMLNQNSFRSKAKWLSIAALPMISLFLYSESRSAIAATLLGVASYVLFIQKGVKRARSLLLGFVFLSFVGPYFLDKYLNQFLSTDDYFGSDQSNSFRLLELFHFYDYFLDTNGFGFGSMSIGDEKTNIIAWSSHVAGYLHGTYSYGLQLSDLGLYAALFQFGVLGLIFALYMTYNCIRWLVSAGLRVDSAIAKDASVLGLTMIFFEINPWPVSYFTLSWSIFIGGVLWCVADEARGLFRTQQLGTVPDRGRALRRRFV